MASCLGFMAALPLAYVTAVNAALWPELLLLAAIGMAGLVGRNGLVVSAAGLVILMRVTDLSRYLPFLAEQGPNLGVLVLVLAALVPVARGQVGWADVRRAISGWPGIAAIVAGAVAAHLTGRGIRLLGAQPEVAAGLIVGSVVGTLLLGGAPAGPLVAAGIAALLVDLGGRLK